MSGFTSVALGGLLAALFLALVAILLWQEARRRGAGEGVTYVVSDAVGHIRENLASEVYERLGDAGIQRVIEWELFYLQGLAQKDRRQPVETVAGGSDSAVSFICQQISQRHPAGITSDDIRAVLALEAHYLQSIGAVGERVQSVAELSGEE
ncbi:MAG: hypothetical protein OXN80_09395 [bacterium]|nr:hypothetical protein [bacterium]MDE0189300.1 hypothetical protein [bacterium]MDE0501442.1 hypothetical protein [bacterium]